MKISKLECIVLLLTAALLAFFAGWYLAGRSAAQPVRITAERTLSAQESQAPPLPTATQAPEQEAPVIVNINTADSAALQSLPGIGEKRAEDIIAYRAANGPFRIPEDLTKVPGIGEGILEGLIEYITAE